MQLRYRRQSVSLIRHVYCPQLRRCRAVTIATLPRGLRVLPAGIEERLKPAELEQVHRLLRHNQLAHEREVALAAALALPQLLQDVALWYRRQARSPELAQRAQATREAWTGVLASMCAAGVGRTRTRRRSG
jgi:hypothetical protein